MEVIWLVPNSVIFEVLLYLPPVNSTIVVQAMYNMMILQKLVVKQGQVAVYL